MYINEYGDPNDPIILALHPMSITGEDLYEALKPYLSGNYLVIAPDQGGHGRSGHYVSFEDEMDTLKTYLSEKGYTDIRLLYAASMGVAAANELLKDPAFHVENIWFDGAGFAEESLKGMGLIKPVMRVVLKFYDIFPGVIAGSFVKHYGPYFGEKMRQNFSQISDEDVIRIFTAISRCIPADLTAGIQKHAHLEWGENDGMSKNSIDIAKNHMPYAKVVIRKGYGHCTYMAHETAAYVKEIEDFMSD